jgi:hypothetical protein
LRTYQISAFSLAIPSTLVELLAAVHINDTIPEALYEAAAEEFAFVYRADLRMKKIERRMEVIGGQTRQAHYTRI